MNRKGAQDCAETLAKMYGIDVKSPRVEELTRWMVNQLTCALCMAEATTDLYETVDRFPTGRQIIPAYNRVNTSAAHQGHLDISSEQHRVSVLETFWHHDAAKLCAGALGNDRVGAFIAAEMWNSHAIAPTAEVVLAEITGAPSIWVRGRVGEPTDEQIRLMFDAARQAATLPLIELTAEQWEQRCELIGAAQDWGKVAEVSA